MHYYLAGFTGTGTDIDPFRPDVVSAATSWTAVDLRGSGAQSVAAGHCLVALDVRPPSDPPGAVYLGTDLDTQLGSPTAQRLSQAVGIAFDPTSENTVRAVLGAMLTKYASDTDPSKPNRLRAEGDGHRRVRFAGTTWEV